ncbi:MAG: hypothetical protein ACTJGH_00320 [Peptoniphilaceae bacterium]
MISEEKLKIYASNFLESEIESIDKLLKENRSEEDRYILSRLKKEYENDLKEIEERFKDKVL